MLTRQADARWEGNLVDGNGTMHMSSGAYEGPFSFQSRFEEGDGTNPEELIAAAHAGCFSMALAGDLGKAGFEPQSVETTASVQLDKVEGGFKISGVRLESRARVPEIDADRFQEIAEGTKAGCPVSQALAAIDISLDAQLVD